MEQRSSPASLAFSVLLTLFASEDGAAERGIEVADGPPEVTIAAPSNGASYQSAATITFAGTATDLQDGKLTVNIEWWSSLDGLLGSGASVTRTDLVEGVHRISATVTDSAGQTDTQHIEITVGAPTVTIRAPADGSEFLPGEPITLIGTASDSQEGDLTTSLSWTSQLDGPLGRGGNLTRADLSPGIHQIRATVTDRAGLSHQVHTVVSVVSGPSVLVGAGDISSCGHERDEATAQLLDGIAGTVYTTGDNVYPDGSAAQFANCYDPTWGRHKARTRPALA